jgi:hypothetical protein
LFAQIVLFQERSRTTPVSVTDMWVTEDPAVSFICVMVPQNEVETFTGLGAQIVRHSILWPASLIAMAPISYGCRPMRVDDGRGTNASMLDQSGELLRGGGPATQEKMVAEAARQ